MLLEANAGDHERAAGAWLSEWGALSRSLSAQAVPGALREALEASPSTPTDGRNVDGVPDQTRVDELIDRALELV